MKLVVEQLVGDQDALKESELDLGHLNKFTGDEYLNDLLFSSLLGIFIGRGVLNATKANQTVEQDIMQFRKEAKDKFVLRADRSYFKSEPALYMVNDEVIMNTKAKANYNKNDAGNNLDFMGNVLLEIKEEMQDDWVGFNHHVISSILYMLRVSKAKTVIFGMGFIDSDVDLMSVLQKEAEDPEKDLETVIFYCKNPNSLVLGGMNEFTTRQVNSKGLNARYEEFYKYL